jgi:hypothetical protein
VTAYASRVQALQLDWQAPASCPTRETILRDVRRLAGANEGDLLAARAVVTETPDQRWRVAIDLSGSATGHRTLTADSCTQLARASALIIALAANPEAALDLPGDDPAGPLSTTDAHGQPSASSGAPPPNRSPQPSLLAPATPEQSPSREPGGDEPKGRPRMSIDLLARTGFEWGSLPVSTAWLGLGVKARFPAYPISFAMTTHLTQATSATFTNGVGARFRVLGTQARLCVEPSSGGWYFAGCSGLQLALMRANGYVSADGLAGSGYGSAVTFTRYRWIPAPLVALNLGYQFLPRFTAELGADAIFPTTRWQFVVENVGTLFRAAEQQYLVHLGLGIRLN